VHWRRERTALYLYQAQTKRKAKTTEVKDDNAMTNTQAPIAVRRTGKLADLIKTKIG
jgi:hypothetical protein